MLNQMDYLAAKIHARLIIDEYGTNPEYFDVVRATAKYIENGGMTQKEGKEFTNIVVALVNSAVISVQFPPISDLLKEKENANGK